MCATEASAVKKVGKAGSSIQRSVETGMAVEYPRGGSAMNRQASRESTDGSMNSYSSEGKYVPGRTPACLCLNADFPTEICVCQSDLPRYASGRRQSVQ